jgi:hypothetical protein
MKRPQIKQALQFLIALIFALSISKVSLGYSVLTHQAIIDSTWENDLKPLLLKRFPAASADQLREAYAHAYGGAIIQDMGYYPFGSKFFSDLAHYVRSGDFVEALIDESRDINEYAFALGALGHYCADNIGHPGGVNPSVAILYPKLRQKYGDKVTYYDHPEAHIKTEFGFDVSQVAQGRYAPESYHDFIGFKVSESVLERAFKKTYGIELKSLFTSFNLAVGTYRYGVSTVIPRLTKVAWETKRDEIEKHSPGISRERFLYTLSRSEYRKNWGSQYQKPGFVAKLIAAISRVVPKVGPFAALAFKPPTPETEELFMQSFSATVVQYRHLLDKVREGRLELQNNDFDTGQPTRAGEYAPADKTYARILDKLAARNFENVSTELRANILAFYEDLASYVADRKDRSDWQKTLRFLARLKDAQVQAGKR